MNGWTARQRIARRSARAVTCWDLHAECVDVVIHERLSEWREFSPKKQTEAEQL